VDKRRSQPNADSTDGREEGKWAGEGMKGMARSAYERFSAKPNKESSPRATELSSSACRPPVRQDKATQKQRGWKESASGDLWSSGRRQSGSSRAVLGKFASGTIRQRNVPIRHVNEK
jgi:hypothetical protein